MVRGFVEINTFELLKDSPVCSSESPEFSEIKGTEVKKFT